MFCLRALRPCIVLLLCAAPALALAQTTVTHTYSTDGTLLWTFDRPDYNQDGVIINCNYPQQNCQTFNIEACNSTKPVQVSVTRGSAASINVNVSPFAGTANAYAWIQPNLNVCSNATYSNTTTDPNVVIDPNVAGTTVNNNIHSLGTATINSASSFAGGGQAITIPDNFISGTLTVGGIMNFPELGNICQPGYELAYTFWQLCVGVDGQGNGYINGPVTTTSSTTSTNQDVVGYFRFPVATEPPTAPSSITSVGLDGRVTINVGLDNSAGNLYGLQVLYTDDPGDLALTTPENIAADPNLDCTAWSHAQTSGIQVIAVGATSGSATIPGINNTEYGYCAQTLDWVGNPSVASLIIQDYPHPECGLFDCWPDDVPIEGGYCGATLAPDWFVGMGALWLAWRHRRRRLLRMNL